MSEIVTEVMFAIWVIVTALLAVVFLLKFGLTFRRTSRGGRRFIVRCAVLLSGAILCVLLNPITNLCIFGKLYEAHCSGMAAFRGSADELVGAYGAPVSKGTYSGCEFWEYRPRPWYILFPVGTVTYEIEDNLVIDSIVDY
jgi:hypothetical protein